ncbi:hypothetical protein FB567DRAFT_590478 [Paraphoma chrysanthemicola]|uniref:Secreted protein n=1 Tax=Paraphoma chrysanthemicola TaxID=798071 RepID=A0A8K0VZY0_9PLEO|nr:hypothetical protein FB567DRAFT_590478 [Paraphoma chrysanthemicola]
MFLQLFAILSVLFSTFLGTISSPITVTVATTSTPTLAAVELVSNATDPKSVNPSSPPSARHELPDVSIPMLQGRCDANGGFPGAFYWVICSICDTGKSHALPTYCYEYDWRNCRWVPSYQICVRITKNNPLRSLGPDPGGVCRFYPNDGCEGKPHSFKYYGGEISDFRCPGAMFNIDLVGMSMICHPG